MSNCPIRRLAIALQGGGSHGAFTWGVLDRLLQEPGFEIVGISGTSAGAMNAGILADGLRRGGAAEARKALEHYWEDLGRLPGYASFRLAALPGVSADIIAMLRYGLRANAPGRPLQQIAGPFWRVQ